MYGMSGSTYDNTISLKSAEKQELEVLNNEQNVETTNSRHPVNSRRGDWVTSQSGYPYCHSSARNHGAVDRRLGNVLGSL
jgi:K+-transporting ATPase c subunit